MYVDCFDIVHSTLFYAWTCMNKYAGVCDYSKLQIRVEQPCFEPEYAVWKLDYQSPKTLNFSLTCLVTVTIFDSLPRKKTASAHASSG